MPDPNQTVMKIIVTRSEIIITDEDCNAILPLKGKNLLRAVCIKVLHSLESDISLDVTNELL